MTALGTEAMVRMGELQVSRDAGDVLVTIGLGSCIGLALIDRTRPLAGLAHIVLPKSGHDGEAPAAKFADLAVPALLGQLTGLGAIAARLDAVLVGGAQMFSFGSSPTLDIGRRNEEATRAALAEAGIAVRAAATGGSKGRTIRVHVDSGRVLVNEPGSAEVEVYGGAR
ncbi:MAG TPA: chemotaxis protein CheD [Gaiellaceae bacterium]|nr:chemotaxis protein CheD [Gaiellaceae bacterium]